MHNFEKNKDPLEEKNRRNLEDEEFREDIREEFASELDFMDPDLAERVRDGEKAGWSSEAKSALEDAAEELGIIGDIERLEEMFLEKWEDEDF